MFLIYEGIDKVCIYISLYFDYRNIIKLKIYKVRKILLNEIYILNVDQIKNVKKLNIVRYFIFK